DILVIDVPEEQDILLGMPWLKTKNPDIDWVEERVRPRSGDLFTCGYYSVQSGTTKYISGKQFRRILKKPRHID
ncbi:hypothetical protein PHYSODRAFT_418994, partial [Phytophthora sojae]